MKQVYHKLLQSDNYINGEFITNKEKLPILQKYTGEKISSVSLASVDQIEKAIHGSFQAFHVFKKFSAEKRSAVLQQLYFLLKENKEFFANLIAAEGGKPISYANSEVSRALDNLLTGARATFEFSGKMVPMDYLNGKGKTAYTLQYPSGVILGITPFNFPLNLALHKLIPAIAVGAPIILKPAPQAPLTLLSFASLINQTELPKGAVQILMTKNELAQKMVEDERIKVLSFTGSDKIGWFLKSIAGKKKVLLEMGGNAAAIIDETADIKRAVKKLVYGSFLNAGQICISTQRIFVLNKLYDEFITLFLHETMSVKSGEMFDEEVINSSMISHKDLLRIHDWVKQAVKQGAKILAGGQILDPKANIYAPTVLTGTKKGMQVYDNEAFAPVVMIEKVNSFKEAVERVNESRYGLQAGVFTNQLKNVLYAQQEIDVGGVIINDIPGFRIDSMPYGGIKDSGLGREGAWYAMQDFTETKLVVLGS